MARVTPAGGMARARQSLGEALGNPDIRAIEAAWTLRVAADWTLLVVGLLLAHELAGAWGVGIFGVARTLPGMVVAMVVDTTRSGRPERALVAVDLVQAVAGAGSFVAVMVGAPVAALVAIAVAAAAGALVRSTQFALLPALAVSPSQLVSANVVASLGESVGTMIGPVVTGYIAAVWGLAPALALGTIGFLLAAVSASRVQVTDAARPEPAERERRVPILLGLRTLAARPPAAAVLASFALQVVVRGALTTLIVLLALDVLRTGESSVGTLNGAIGLGGIIGALGALWLAGRQAFAPVFALALVGWGLPIALIGALPLLPVAVLAMLVVGLSNALLDVSGFTLLQRGTPNRSRTAVFAVLETLAGLAGAAGAVLASALVEITDVPGAFVAVGVVLPIAAVATWPLLRRLDREGVVPEDQAELLRRIPAFALLPLSGLERLAEGMVPARYEAGQPLMVEGDPGDRYIVLASGHVVVTAEGRELRRQGPGEGLGDIALLRRVPRTATVTAIDVVEGYEIDCATFVAAVAGHPGSAAVAEDLVRERLAPQAAGAGQPAATINP